MGPYVPLQRDLVLYAASAIPKSPLLFSWLSSCSTQYWKTASTTWACQAHQPHHLAQITETICSDTGLCVTVPFITMNTKSREPCRAGARAPLIPIHAVEL